MSNRYETIRYWRLGVGVAAFTHLACALAVVLSPLLTVLLSGTEPVAATAEPILFVARTGESAALPASELPASELQPSSDSPTPSIAEYVRNQVAQRVSDAESSSPDENLARLKQWSGRLQNISSEESLNQLATQLQTWLGGQSRAAEAQPVSAGQEFDFRTAQLHDVGRTEGEPGKFVYHSIMIDAQGRTMEVPLSEDQGSRLFEIWEVVKSNPLLEKVYRQIVMGLLDQMAE